MDPQQEAANREALLRQLLGGSELTPPAPIAPVASHPARDAVVLESRRTPKRRSYAQTERAKINETPEISLGEMRGIENNWEPGFEGRMTRPDWEFAQQLAMGLGPLSLDDVAAKMGKPAGAFKSVVVQLPDGNVQVQIKEIAREQPRKPGGSFFSDPGLAGYMNLGARPVEGHLPVEMVYLRPPYRGKGMGRELYQEAIAAAKQKGHRGLASDPGQRNASSEKMWQNPTGYAGDEGYDLMSEWRELSPAEPQPQSPRPSQYVAPGQPHPLVQQLQELFKKK